MHLSFSRFDPQGGVGCQAKMLYATSLNLSFEEFEGSCESVKEHIVCVVGALGFIRVVQIVEIESFKVQSLQTFLKLIF